MVKVYSLEGNIGSGKSTLIRELKKINKDFIFVFEPVDEWALITDNKGENILTKFYRDKKSYSFSFQMMAYISRLVELKKIITKNPQAIIITERSIMSDKNIFAKMLYDEGNIEEVNYIIYLKWFDEFIKDIPHIGYIYLDVRPEISYQRVLKRNRCGETISLSYLNKCHQYHEKWLSNEKNILILDGNSDFENDKHSIHNINKKIYHFLQCSQKKCSQKIFNKNLLGYLKNCHHC